MKKLKKYEIGILASIPLLYVAGYFAFLAVTQPSPTPVPGSLTLPESVTIITGKVPLGNYGVKIFRPAINLHQKMTGDMFIIKGHELT